MLTVQPTSPLQWRHNGRDGVSNNQTHDCLPNRLFRRRSKKTSKLRVTGLCVGNSPVTGEFSALSISLYYIYVYIYYIYWNICMMKFLWNFISEFFFKQIGSCHGTGFVVAGGTAGCHNNLRCRQGWQSGLCGSSRLFNVQCIQCTHDLSLLAPIFHPKLSKMLHSSPVRARYGVSFVSYGFWW